MQLVKPERSRHCEICRRCVSVYDHHCPWVANCVGSKNYCLFYAFIAAIEAFMIFTVIFEIISTPRPTQTSPSSSGTGIPRSKSSASPASSSGLSAA
jgi:hypothetical protein